MYKDSLDGNNNYREMAVAGSKNEIEKLFEMNVWVNHAWNENMINKVINGENIKLENIGNGLSSNTLKNHS